MVNMLKYLLFIALSAVSIAQNNAVNEWPESSSNVTFVVVDELPEVLKNDTDVETTDPVTADEENEQNMEAQTEGRSGFPLSHVSVPTRWLGELLDSLGDKFRVRNRLFNKIREPTADEIHQDALTVPVHPRTSGGGGAGGDRTRYFLQKVRGSLLNVLQMAGQSLDMLGDQTPLSVSSTPAGWPTTTTIWDTTTTTTATTTTTTTTRPSVGSPRTFTLRPQQLPGALRESASCRLWAATGLCHCNTVGCQQWSRQIRRKCPLHCGIASSASTTTTTTTMTTTTTTTTTTTGVPVVDDVLQRCRATSLPPFALRCTTEYSVLPHPIYCQCYYQCLGGRKHLLACPAGQHVDIWAPEGNRCVWASRSTCAIRF